MSFNNLLVKSTIISIRKTKAHFQSLLQQPKDATEHLLTPNTNGDHNDVDNDKNQDDFGVGNDDDDKDV